MRRARLEKFPALIRSNTRAVHSESRPELRAREPAAARAAREAPRARREPGPPRLLLLLLLRGMICHFQTDALVSC